jgi:prefoldin subunit 5|tara:strand:- start:323 stop:472 length:150 start_codon:yes stop_codon:yes gene_type:complete
MQTTNEILHKNIETLKNQLKEKDETILKLRKELETLGFKKVEQSWVEND